MVTASTRGRRGRDGDRSDGRTDRGQVILIGAVALAFIVLGVVVVFNGVLYTETLSSADTGQTASSADATELEVRQGIACLAANTEGNYSDGDIELSSDEVTSLESGLENDIETYAAVYRNSTAHSRPAAVDIRESDFELTNDNGTVSVADTVTVTLTYDSSESSYERTLEIRPEECPESSDRDTVGDNGESDSEDGSDGSDGEDDGSGSPSIDQFDINVDDGSGWHNYDVNWKVSGEDLTEVRITFSNEDDNQNVSSVEYSGEDSFQSHQNDEVYYIEIVAEYENEETIQEREEY